MHQNRIFLIFLLFIAKVICNEYCQLWKDHVLCVNPPQGKACTLFKEFIPNIEQQQAIVDFHNRMRQKVALGKEFRGKGGPQPPASNMMKMEWDPELAKIAQSTVNQCKEDHDCYKCRGVLGTRFLVGQNMASISVPQGDQNTINFVSILYSWYEMEVLEMEPNVVNTYNIGVWGHYTQVVWWNSRSVGCGAASYRSKIFPNGFDTLVVCNYGAAANLIATKAYEIGKACSKCPGETECDTKYTGLCSITRKDFKYNDKFPTDQVYLGISEGSIIEI